VCRVEEVCILLEGFAVKVRVKRAERLCQRAWLACMGSGKPSPHPNPGCFEMDGNGGKRLQALHESRNFVYS
jgi:hypothetical protein